MRKTKLCVVVVLCLLVTAPALAVDEGNRASWWDAVVNWVVDVVRITPERGAEIEPPGVHGVTLPTSDIEHEESEAGANSEPNG